MHSVSVVSKENNQLLKVDPPKVRGSGGRFGSPYRWLSMVALAEARKSTQLLSGRPPKLRKGGNSSERGFCTVQPPHAPNPPPYERRKRGGLRACGRSELAHRATFSAHVYSQVFASVRKGFTDLIVAHAEKRKQPWCEVDILNNTRFSRVEPPKVRRGDTDSRLRSSARGCANSSVSQRVPSPFRTRWVSLQDRLRTARMRRAFMRKAAFRPASIPQLSLCPASSQPLQAQMHAFL